MSIKKNLFTAILALATRVLFAQYGTWEGSVVFTHDVTNEVSYINIGNIGWYGALDVTAFGSWNYGASFGKITKSFSFYHAADATSLSTYYSEVSTVFGSISSRYSIGEVEIYETNKVRIPIYKINSTDGTTLKIKIDIFSSGYVNQMISALNITPASSGVGSSARNHVSIMTSNVGVGTTTPNVKLDVKSSVVGYPVISGTTQTNGSYRMGSTQTGVILDFGVNGGNEASSWIQSTCSADLSKAYNLYLNPNGGIGITRTFGYKLAVNGTIGAKEITSA